MGFFFIFSIFPYSINKQKQEEVRMNKEMKFCDVIKMCPANGFDFMTQSGYLRLTTHDANKLTPDSIIYGHPGFQT